MINFNLGLRCKKDKNDKNIIDGAICPIDYSSMELIKVNQDDFYKVIENYLTYRQPKKFLPSMLFGVDTYGMQFQLNKFSYLMSIRVRDLEDLEQYQNAKMPCCLCLATACDSNYEWLGSFSFTIDYSKPIPENWFSKDAISRFIAQAFLLVRTNHITNFDRTKQLKTLEFTGELYDLIPDKMEDVTKHGQIHISIRVNDPKVGEELAYKLVTNVTMERN